jgi:beta-glucanase (GH16 family)
MMVDVSKLIGLALAVSLAAPLPAQDTVSVAAKGAKTVEVHHAPAGYELVFQDEFSRDGMLDASKWDYATERNAQGWFNREKQYYARARAKNSRVENGHLIIEAHAEELTKSEYPDWGGQKFTSARVVTRGRAAWTYGFYEIKAKLPCGTGTWPAIWTLPEDPDVVWPNGGEIDIMEHVGFEPGVVHQSIHTKAHNFRAGTQKTNKFDVPDACDAMHRYQLLWTPEFILLGMDDAPKFLYKNDKGNASRWPFDKPHHLLLNIAVGGEWGGQKGVNPKAFPARMEIDYVRIYKLKTSASAPGVK